LMNMCANKIWSFIESFWRKRLPMIQDG
jgi:hypothetical protein